MTGDAYVRVWGTHLTTPVVKKEYAKVCLATSLEMPEGKKLTDYTIVTELKDADGKVRSYFPSSRGFKTAHYTLALYIDRENHKLVKSLLFDDKKDPYQMNNLPLEENQEIVKELCTKMGKVLEEIDDPWYKERILSDMIPYGEQ